MPYILADQNPQINIPFKRSRLSVEERKRIEKKSASYRKRYLEPGLPCAISNSVCYIDTVQIWLSRKIENKWFDKLRASAGSVNCFQELMLFHEQQWRFRMVIHQPSPQTFHILAQIAREREILINMFQLALDLIVGDRLALMLLNGWLLSHLIQPWHGGAEITLSHGVSLYLKPPGRINNIDVYSDRLSKTDNLSLCVHVELRVSGEQAIKQQLGIANVEDLARFGLNEAQELLVRKLGLGEIKKRALGKLARKCLVRNGECSEMGIASMLLRSFEKCDEGWFNLLDKRIPYLIQEVIDGLEKRKAVFHKPGKHLFKESKQSWIQRLEIDPLLPRSFHRFEHPFMPGSFHAF